MQMNDYFIAFQCWGEPRKKTHLWILVWQLQMFIIPVWRRLADAAACLSGPCHGDQRRFIGSVALCVNDARFSWPVVVDSDWRRVTADVGVDWIVCLVMAMVIRSGVESAKSAVLASFSTSKHCKNWVFPSASQLAWGMVTERNPSVWGVGVANGIRLLVAVEQLSGLHSVDLPVWN